MDWTVHAPWGKITGLSWGDPHNPPVLLAHGYMDSAATFVPLVKLLPADMYYVAVDMPGHGRSDAFPLGPAVTHVHQVEAARRVVEHLGWTSFIYISHSVGFIIGVLYNAVYPGRIKRMVHIDPVLALTTYCYYQYEPTVWFFFTHIEYYDHKTKWDVQRNKTFTYEEAVHSVMSKRKVNREQAEVLLSRGLISDGEGKYRFSWEPTMRKVSGVPMTEDTLYSLMKLSPPTLNIVAEDSVNDGNVIGVQLIKKCANTINSFLIVDVIGAHDVHVTNPERFANVIKNFIKDEYNNKSLVSKL